MIPLQLQLAVSLLLSLITEPERCNESPCDVTVCCDVCTGQNGSNYCRGCEGAGADGECETDQTEIPCPPGTCYQGNAKVHYGTGWTDACS